jgi:hypothetical protein
MLLQNVSKLRTSGCTAMGPGLTVAIGKSIVINISTMFVLTTATTIDRFGSRSTWRCHCVGNGWRGECWRRQRIQRNLLSIDCTPSETKRHQREYTSIVIVVCCCLLTCRSQINVITLEGEDCSMENIGLAADLTSGQVEIVDPLDMSTVVGSLLERRAVATA